MNREREDDGSEVDGKEIVRRHRIDVLGVVQSWGFASRVIGRVSGAVA